MITILCAGSRGDFQPYVALALELQKQSQTVRIAGSREFEPFVRSFGVDYDPLQVDIESLQVDPKLLKQAGSADNPLKMLLAFNKMKKYGIYMTREFYDACVGSELIVYHPGVTLGYFAAKQLGIPAVLASPFPLHKTRAYPSVIRYGRSKSSPLRNLSSYSMLQGMLWMASGSSVKSFWKQQFGGTPTDFGRPYERHDRPEQPAFVSCSNHVFGRPDDWNPNIHQHGYWFLEEPQDYVPPQPLADFLASGDKPVYVGFGSVSPRDRKDEIAALIVDALKRSGKRGIISGLGALEGLPDPVIAVDNIPHAWLFRRTAAVCHHGGAGTTAEGFRAGVPSLIVPFANDQFAWAHRAYDLGVGAPALPFKELTADRLAEAIRYATQPQIAAQARELGSRLASENGAQASAAIIARLAERQA